MNPNSYVQPADYFNGLRPLSRLSKGPDGRLLIPSSQLLNPHGQGSSFSETDLNRIYQELLWRRTRWRIRFYSKALAVLCFLLWTFWLMPCAAAHRWPFR
jgi:hypothetical protein